MLTKLILSGVLGLFAFSSAHAEVVVRPHAVKYGALQLIGQGNPNPYYGSDYSSETTPRYNTSYSVTMKSTGTKSSDDGNIGAQELNKVVKLRVGTYSLEYDNTFLQVDVKEGQVTKINLVKLKASPMDGAGYVKLYNPNYVDSDNVMQTVATWSHYRSKVVGKECKIVSGFPFGFPRQSCSNKYEKTAIPWSTATFWVLPGTYVMEWSLKDGTTHTESDIQAK